ncbi:energy-coupling factor transporter transmembrane component T [Treponema vincentii]|uniref:energy-coupling factor transporter transmembrane component T n=1 Tax=Treponema vincentii TaxID=69710 RepID=UPI0035F5453A
MKQTASMPYKTKRQNDWAFDPRTKVLLLIELDMLIFLGRSLFYETGVFLLCSLILIVGGQCKMSLKYIGIFVIFAGIEHLIRPYMAHFSVSLIYFAVVIIRKVLPVFILAKWLIATTEVSAFVAALWEMRLPRNMIITGSVIFRCFPTIREEWTAIQSAMRMRGIECNARSLLFKPSETITYILIPLFISILNISDELAAAALCRGLDNPGTHTCMTEIGFRLPDVIFLILITGIFTGLCTAKMLGVVL